MGLDSDSKIELNHSLLNRMETTHVQHTPDMNSITIYVKLLDEETPTIRPTSGIHVVNNIYRLLPAPNYDPEDETWLFPPGSLVQCEWRDHSYGDRILVAIALAPESYG